MDWEGGCGNGGGRVTVREWASATFPGSKVFPVVSFASGTSLHTTPRAVRDDIPSFCLSVFIPQGRKVERQNANHLVRENETGERPNAHSPVLP